MELGLYTFLGFGLQAIGLETTTASRSAFLLYLNVKINVRHTERFTDLFKLNLFILILF